MRGVHVQGDIIRRLRSECGFTQDQLALQAGCDVTTIRKMEKGEKAFDVQSVVALAQALNCHVTRLIVPSTAPPELSSQEQVNLACVARHRDGFARKDVEQVLSCYTDDAVISFPSSIPSPSSGLFEGREAIRRHLELTFQTFTPHIPTLEESDVHAFADQVLLRQAASAVVNHNGAVFTSYLLFEFYFRDGKIYKHVGLFDTAVMAEALNAPANSANPRSPAGESHRNSAQNENQ
jgi:ketosteroid isomerase-like protein